MKIVIFTFYYPPDLCAGSFRAISLVEALSKKISSKDEVHVITTHPNRYRSHKVSAKDIETEDNIMVHRVQTPSHQGGMISQARIFMIFSWHALRYCFRIKPDFLIGTTSRLMTGVLTWLSARLQQRTYYIDLRDIFSETISDLFARKNQLLGATVKHVFAFLERRVLNGAAGVNVVSEGFPEYFQANGVDTSNWSFFPNGVDKQFIDFPSTVEGKSQGIKTILYAGNIGSGQGLEKIIPAVAKCIGDSYRFVIVGDGGTISLLRDVIRYEGVSNVELLPPVERSELIKYYQSADILFLHLNNIPAFMRVLPSKIFEYASLKRPIVAGLSGYPEQFIKKNLEHVCLFNPVDIASCIECIQRAGTLIVDTDKVNNFVNKYSRDKIMARMAENILSKAVH